MCTVDLSALEVCSRRGAIQIHVYLYLYLTLAVQYSCHCKLHEMRSCCVCNVCCSRTLVYMASVSEKIGNTAKPHSSPVIVLKCIFGIYTHRINLVVSCLNLKMTNATDVYR